MMLKIGQEISFGGLTAKVVGHALLGNEEVNVVELPNELLLTFVVKIKYVLVRCYEDNKLEVL